MACRGLYAQCGFSVVSAPQADSLLDIAENVWEAWRDSIRKMQSAAWSITAVAASAGGQTLEYVESVVGDLSGLATTPGVCALLAKVPTNGPPGRLYVPGLPEFVVDERGRLEISAHGALQNDATALLQKLDEKDLQMAIRRPNGTLDAVTDLQLRTYVGRRDGRLIRGRS